MPYNLKNESQKREAFAKLEYHAKNGHTVELKKIENIRTGQQNRALHLYFKHVANALVEVGFDYCYVNPISGEIIRIPFTKELVKEYIWKQIQETMFQIESTTQLTTPMINDMLSVLSLWLGEKNKEVSFPNRLDQLIENML